LLLILRAINLLVHYVAKIEFFNVKKGYGMVTTVLCRAKPLKFTAILK
jgi:hypothetical protein